MPHADFHFNVIKYLLDSSFLPDERADPANAVHSRADDLLNWRRGFDVPSWIRSNASVSPCTFRPFRRNFQPTCLSASQISPLTSNNTNEGWSPGPKVLYKSRGPWPIASVQKYLHACQQRGAWSLLTPVNITHVTRPSRHTCSPSCLRQTSWFQCYFASLFGLLLRPEALKSLCFSSAGLSRLPASAHCCLSTNKAKRVIERKRPSCMLSTSLLNRTLT